MVGVVQLIEDRILCLEGAIHAGSGGPWEGKVRGQGLGARF